MKITKSVAKVAAVATGLAMATSMLSLAPIAHAATTTTTTTTTTACSVGTFNLTIGSVGASVTCLQSALIKNGYSIPAGATGYFGTQTRAAVASWQSAMNIAPAVGYFGPISRSAWNLSGGASSSTTTTTSTVAGCAAGAAFSATTGAACTVTSTVAGCAVGAAFSATTGVSCSGGTTTTTTTTSGPLTGSGRLTNLSSLSDTTSDLHEGDAATSVAGFSAKATDGDVSIQRVDVTLDITPGTTGSSNLDQYVSDVSLWLDGKKIANMDPALGDKATNAVWTLRFSGLNGVIRSGQTGNLYVKVTPVTSISSSNTGSTTVSFGADSVRAVGADGISDTYTPSATGSFTVTATTNGTLTVSLANDNPTVGLVAVSSSTTSGVKLLSFNMKAKNQAVTVTDLGASIGVTGSTVGAVVSNVKLMKGSTVIKTGTINGVTTGTYNTVTFSGVDQTIAKDVTGSYWISVDLKPDTYVDGTTIVASTTDASAIWDVSDAGGATVTVTPATAVGGNAQTLTAAGISVAFVSSSATRNTYSIAGSPDSVTDTIVFTVSAGDNDIWVEGDIAAAGILPVVGMDGLSWATTTDSSTGTTTAQTGTLTADKSNTSDITTGNSPVFKVPSNSFRTFTFTTTIPSGGANLMVGARITGIKYQATTNSGDVLTGLYTVNMGDFRTTTLQGLNWR